MSKFSTPQKWEKNMKLAQNRRCTSSICEQSLHKVWIKKNETFWSYRLHKLGTLKCFGRTDRQTDEQSGPTTRPAFAKVTQVMILLSLAKVSYTLPCQRKHTHWEFPIFLPLLTTRLLRCPFSPSETNKPSNSRIQPITSWAVAWDFQQFDILTSVDSYQPLQPPFKLGISKWCSVSSLTIIEYSSH